MEKIVSGEEHQEILRRNTSNKSINLKVNKSSVAVVILLIIVAGLGFIGGMTYQKHQKTSSSTTASTNGRGAFGGGGNFADRVIGTVTAISSTSISVQDSRTGNTDTLAITNSTTITDNGQTVTYSDIQVGDTVFATENSSNTSQASRILVNPSFGGFGGAGGGGQSSSQGTTDSEQSQPNI